MSFIQEILKFNSLSIVGLEKNTGKTECLNFILRNLPSDQVKVAVSSIGIDGEGLDQVTHTAKPEIILRKGMFFSTSEKHYKTKKIISELVDISNETTSLGRIVTAKALTDGKILLSGPASGISLKRWMKEIQKLNVDLVIIDGALSRLSSASPAISESMILSTGAAYSADMKTLIQKTAFVVDLINISLTEEKIIAKLDEIDKGVWMIDSEDNLRNLNISSSFALNEIQENFLEDCKILYVTGALTDRFLNLIRQNKKMKAIELIVRDFTKIFASSQTYKMFLKMGGKISVLQKSKLIAVCVNPTSPSGYVLNSDILCEKLSEAISLPVYDIVKNGKSCSLN